MPEMQKKAAKGKTPQNESLADYTRRIMDEKNLTFREVERLSDGKILAASVNKLINGHIEDVRVSSLVALARGLGVPPYLLLQKHLQDETLYEDASKERFASMFHKYNQLSPEEQASLDNLLEVIDSELDKRVKKRKQ